MSQSGAWREGISLSAQRQLWWPCSVCQDVMPACEGQRQPFLQAPWCNTKCLGFMSSSRCSRIGQRKDLKNPQPPDKNSFSYALPPTCSSSKADTSLFGIHLSALQEWGVLCRNHSSKQGTTVTKIGLIAMARQLHHYAALRTLQNPSNRQGNYSGSPAPSIGAHCCKNRFQATYFNS